MMRSEDQDATLAPSGNVDYSVPHILQPQVDVLSAEASKSTIESATFRGIDDYVCVGLHLHFKATLNGGENARVAATTLSSAIDRIRVYKALSNPVKLAEIEGTWLPTTAAMLYAISHEAQRDLFGNNPVTDAKVTNNASTRTLYAQYGLPMRLGTAPLQVDIKFFPLDKPFSATSASSLDVAVTPMYAPGGQLDGASELRYYGEHLDSIDTMRGKGRPTIFCLAAGSRLSSKVASIEHGGTVHDEVLDRIEDITSKRLQTHFTQGSAVSSTTWPVRGIKDVQSDADSHIMVRSLAGAQAPAIAKFKENIEALTLSVGPGVTFDG